MTFSILTGDSLEVLRTLPDESVQCCVTSPPYWGLRDYGVPGQMGLEDTPDAFVAALVAVMAEVRRVLRPDGTLWLNLGDSYANDGKWGGSTGGKHVAGVSGAGGPGRRKTTTGLKPKDLIGIPWLVAFALRADGWYLRSDIIWAKPNPMPESVTDRPTSAHEHIFLLSKSKSYYYDADAIREPWTSGRDDMREKGVRTGMAYLQQEQTPSNDAPKPRTTDKQRGHPRRHAGFNDRWDAMPREEQLANGANARNVWTIATQPYAAAHFATFPEELPRRCILAGSAIGDTVLDPFCGSGTTGLVAEQIGRSFIGIELNPAYVALATQRCQQAGLFSAQVPAAALPALESPTLALDD